MLFKQRQLNTHNDFYCRAKLSLLLSALLIIVMHYDTKFQFYWNVRILTRGDGDWQAGILKRMSSLSLVRCADDRLIPTCLISSNNCEKHYDVNSRSHFDNTVYLFIALYDRFIHPPTKCRYILNYRYIESGMLHNACVLLLRISAFVKGHLIQLIYL